MNVEDTPDRQRERRHGRKVYWVFALLSVLSLAIWLGTMQWKDHLTVYGIIVEGEHILTKEDVVKLSMVSLKTKMFEADLTGIEKNIMKNHFVKKVAVTRDAPGIIRISVVERTPIALLLTPGSSDLLSVDDEGYVLPHSFSQSMFDLPIISGIDSLAGASVGQRTPHADVLDAIDVLEASQRVSNEMFHMISEIRIHSGHDMVLYSADSGIPILFGRGDAVKKMVKLDAFWKKFIAESAAQDIRYIDVRFDDQVVVSSRSADSQTVKKSS
jgi:cell division protein FtsQ